ncbi:MAG: AAA family ATPase [Desulfovibrionaceae bacterium]|nr:AAA family ATPase [Desulfovibrionaceae bacterium]
MIKKFKSINMGIFNNFQSDVTLKDFKYINIFYGRNYSGKTTLSRMIRGLEIGFISDKYKDCTFQIELDDGGIITQSTIQNHKETIRVFNSDFVGENFKFFNNPDEGIKSFAMLGDENIKIDQNIKYLESILGKNIDEKSGLYKKLFDETEKNKKLQKDNDKEIKILDKKLQDKATDRNNGIKYNNKFGEINYTINSLKKDLETVLYKKISPFPNDKVTELEETIKEKQLSPIETLASISFSLPTLIEQTKNILSHRIMHAEHLQELLENHEANTWVRQGMPLHSIGDICFFCGNPISKTRWNQLNNHFNESFKKLESDLKKCIEIINIEKNKLKNINLADSNCFYTKFNTEIINCKKDFLKYNNIYIQSLDNLIIQLKEKQKNPFLAIEFKNIEDCTKKIDDVLLNYNTICIKSNLMTSKLEAIKKDSKNKLRLNEVAIFEKNINYWAEKKLIQDLQKIYTDHTEYINKIELKIIELKSKIEEQKKLLSNEELSVKHINHFLELSSSQLTIECVSEKDNSLQFVIMRQGTRAFNLSEGECSLIAFCYFIAKLNDYETKNKQPIIWIDDPISSLDTNHIFFIYSLINSYISENLSFKQLFISTHNLEFLKFLKRLAPPFYNGQRFEANKNKQYFLISRTKNNSIIKMMPTYLQKNVSEFLHIFRQIYKCSCIDESIDDNYEYIYNFANNARKFLELYLFYKLPAEKDYAAYKEFFGDNIPACLAMRINNEFSHLSGTMERGSFPIDTLEIKIVANTILERLKILDKKQYDSLCKAIGEE